MVVFRILLFVGLLFLLWIGWRWLRSMQRPSPRQAIPQIRRCARCGVVLPPESARECAGRDYCPEHAHPD